MSATRTRPAAIRVVDSTITHAVATKRPCVECSTLAFHQQVLRATPAAKGGSGPPNLSGLSVGPLPGLPAGSGVRARLGLAE